MYKILFSLTLFGVYAATATAQIAEQSAAGIFLSSPQTITGLSACDGVNDLIDQPLGAFTSASTSDEELDFATRENPTSAGAAVDFPADTLIGSLRIWGLSLELGPGGFVGPCSDDDATAFNVSTLADNAGVPGTVIDQGTATATVIDTGTPFALGANILQVDLAVVGSVDASNAGWVSAQRQTGNNTPGGNQCVFLHVNESDFAIFDNLAYQNITPLTAGGGDPTQVDLTMCAQSGNPDVLPPPPAVPTMNSFGLLGMALALMLGAGLFLRRRA
jgi:hypothetical protein